LTILEVAEYKGEDIKFVVWLINEIMYKTYLVKTSPTYVKKNVGDTNGAKNTCLIATHNGFLIFQGKIRHLQVYMMRKVGYNLGGIHNGISPTSAL